MAEWLTVESNGYFFTRTCAVQNFREAIFKFSDADFHVGTLSEKYGHNLLSLGCGNKDIGAVIIELIDRVANIAECAVVAGLLRCSKVDAGIPAAGELLD